MMKHRVHPGFALFGAVLAACLVSVPAARADEVVTVPEGYVTLTVANGTGTTRTTSALSLPMAEPASVPGQTAGRITGLTANSISNADAGWTPGNLSVAATPHLIRITSGAAVGRTFLISTQVANTATTVTLDAEEAALTDLTSLGILTGAQGDTYEILACDTLASIFGTTGSPTGTDAVLSGANATVSDNVQLFVSGGWRQYYLHSTNGWRRIGPNTLSNTLAVRPDAAIIYSRLASTTMNLVVVGRVPHVERRAFVANSGTTLLAGGWPKDLTLGTSNIHNIPGWVRGTSSVADTVQLLIAGGWRTYYHDNTQWRRVGPNTPSDPVVIPSGSAAILVKKGTAPGASLLSQTVPYSLAP